MGGPRESVQRDRETAPLRVFKTVPRVAAAEGAKNIRAESHQGPRVRPRGALVILPPNLDLAYFTKRTRGVYILGVYNPAAGVESPARPPKVARSGAAQEEDQGHRWKMTCT